VLEICSPLLLSRHRHLGLVVVVVVVVVVALMPAVAAKPCSCRRSLVACGGQPDSYSSFLSHDGALLLLRG
jgi:hypothetical protein